MDKNEPIIFWKYGQLYEGTFHSADGNRVKVASVSGGIHVVDASHVQTAKAYLASIKDKEKEIEK